MRVHKTQVMKMTYIFWFKKRVENICNRLKQQSVKSSYIQHIINKWEKEGQSLNTDECHEKST
jgi:hypothetical protein